MEIKSAPLVEEWRKVPESDARSVQRCVSQLARVTRIASLIPRTDTECSDPEIRSCVIVEVDVLIFPSPKGRKVKIMVSVDVK